MTGTPGMAAATAPTMALTSGTPGHYATWPRGAFRFCVLSALPGPLVQGIETEHLVDITAPAAVPSTVRTLCGLDAADRYDLGLAVIPLVVVGRSTPSEEGGRVLCCPTCATTWLVQHQALAGAPAPASAAPAPVAAQPSAA